MKQQETREGRGRHRGRLLGGLAMAFGLATLLWMRSTEWRRETDSGVGGVSIPSSGSTAVRLSLPAAPPPSAAAETGLVEMQASVRLDEEVMLAALKQWIRRREGKEVEIVESQKVHDGAGQPVSLNVLVTSLPQGPRAEELHRGLAELAVRERELRKEMQVAYGQQDVPAVNRLAAAFEEARSAFIATNQVSAYKLSLTRDEPPVLAFWQGLNFETVREPESRRLAARTLGETAGLHRLVAYTSVASLLAFTNVAGEVVYVDPVRVATVAGDRVAQLGSARVGADGDPGRETRIAHQWLEMLGSASAGAN